MFRSFVSFVATSSIILTILLHHASAMGCFPPSSSLKPAVFAECLRVIEKIPSIVPNPNIPLVFSKNPADRPDIRLPTFWRDTGDRCVIGLRLRPEAEGPDRMNLIDLKGFAKDVALKCIIRPPHLGGETIVGWNEKLMLSVARPAERPDGSLETE